jgi:hypothetical protein
MSNIASGTLTAFFLFDVADSINLPHVQQLIGSTVATRFAAKPPAPPYVQYREPPISIEGAALDVLAVDGFHVRFKAFDYGVISIALTRPLPSSWERLLHEAAGWFDTPQLAESAERLCRAAVARLAPAIVRLRHDFLSEDYFVTTVTRLTDIDNAEALLARHGDTIVQVLRGERERLSAQERAEVLRHMISYLASDLVVPAWNGAFVYDTEAGAQGALEILEFANSQLLEFRYYDRLLDRELERIYAQLQEPRWFHSWIGRRHTRAARQIHSLFIDLSELTDRTENALKFVGDVYAARLFALAGARLGLDQWKANVREKLKTLDDIYRFSVEQTSMTRGEFMEATIVLILVIEFVLLLAGIME